MIRFGTPLALLAAPVVLGLLFRFARRGSSYPLFRALVALLFVVAISDPRIVTQDSTNNVLFLVDRSASVTRSVDDRDAVVAMEAIAAAQPRWSYGVVGFAESAGVESPLGSTPAARSQTAR